MGQCLRFMTETKAEKQQRHLNAIILGLQEDMAHLDTLMARNDKAKDDNMRKIKQLKLHYQDHTITRSKHRCHATFANYNKLQSDNAEYMNNQAQTQRQSA